MRGLLVALFLLACVAPACAARAQDPRFTSLVDQRGMPFVLADLRGRPTFVTFVASRCSDACPIANGEFSLLAQRLARRGMRANLVTITLDPAYDTPFVMAGVALRYHANHHVWRFASGRLENVRRMMRAFGVVTQLDGHGVPDVHSTFVFLLDAHVRLARTLLLSTTFSADASQALALATR